MKVTLKLAREYAQLWIEYRALQAEQDKHSSTDTRFFILTVMKTAILDRLSEINQHMAADIRKAQQP